MALGPRVPGTPPHGRLLAMLEDRLRSSATEVMRQDSRVPFRGQAVSCANIIGAFRCANPSRRPGSPGHAFRHAAPGRQGLGPRPAGVSIPGANDGGPGTAIFQHMLEWLALQRLSRDVLVAFFDAEDLGNIDGNDSSMGAEWCACHPAWGVPPAEVVVLDMVGGVGMVFDIDATYRLPRRALTQELFGLGTSRGWAPFTQSKPQRLKYIISDHHPFARGGPVMPPH